jgi:hypothetical protein
MSNPASMLIPSAHTATGEKIGVLFVIAVAAALLITTTLLLVRGAPSEVLDSLTSPAALVGRTT